MRQAVEALRPLATTAIEYRSYKMQAPASQIDVRRYPASNCLTLP